MEFKLDSEIEEKFGYVKWEDVIPTINLYSTAIRVMVKQMLNGVYGQEEYKVNMEDDVKSNERLTIKFDVGIKTGFYEPELGDTFKISQIDLDKTIDQMTIKLKLEI